MIQKFKDYQPSKGALVVTALTATALTMVIGFNWGGWVSGSRAQAMAEEATQDAREQLVASICVKKFVSTFDAADNLEELKETTSYHRDDFIEDGGWATIVALDEQVPGAVDLCVERLVEMESLPKTADTTAKDSDAG